MRDLIILFGMGAAFTSAAVSAIFGRLLAVRIGSLVGGAAICVGLGYSGWLPLFGGIQTPETYFGCAMLFIGIVSLLLFNAVDKLAARTLVPRGIPVEVTPSQPTAPTSMIARAGRT